MLKVFNCFQFVAFFMAIPHLMSWLATNPFPNANLAFYTTGVVYAIMAIINIAVFENSSDRW